MKKKSKLIRTELGRDIDLKNHILYLNDTINNFAHINADLKMSGKLDLDIVTVPNEFDGWKLNKDWKIK